MRLCNSPSRTAPLRLTMIRLWRLHTEGKCSTWLRATGLFLLEHTYPFRGLAARPRPRTGTHMYRCNTPRRRGRRARLADHRQTLGAYPGFDDGWRTTGTLT